MSHHLEIEPNDLKALKRDCKQHRATATQMLRAYRTFFNRMKIEFQRDLVQAAKRRK